MNKLPLQHSVLRDSTSEASAIARFDSDPQEFELDIAHKHYLGLPTDAQVLARSRTWRWDDFTFVGNSTGEDLGSVTDFSVTLNHTDTSSRPYYAMWLTVTFRVTSHGWRVDILDNIPKLTVTLNNSSDGEVAFFTDIGFNGRGRPAEYNIGCANSNTRRAYILDDLSPDYYDIAVRASRTYDSGSWERCP